MKRYTRQSETGFIFYLVIVILALMGSALYMLTRMSNGMRRQTDEMYLEISERNLTASGGHWAWLHREDWRDKVSSESYLLDVSALDVPGGKLALSRADQGETPDKLIIETNCTRRKITLHKKTTIDPALP
jgi:hypothetical protein